MLPSDNPFATSCLKGWNTQRSFPHKRMLLSTLPWRETFARESVDVERLRGKERRYQNGKAGKAVEKSNQLTFNLLKSRMHIPPFWKKGNLPIPAQSYWEIHGLVYTEFCVDTPFVRLTGQDSQNRKRVRLKSFLGNPSLHRDSHSKMSRVQQRATPSSALPKQKQSFT